MHGSLFMYKPAFVQDPAHYNNTYGSNTGANLSKLGYW